MRFMEMSFGTRMLVISVASLKDILASWKFVQAAIVAGISCADTCRTGISKKSKALGKGPRDRYYLSGKSRYFLEDLRESGKHRWVEI